MTGIGVLELKLHRHFAGVAYFVAKDDLVVEQVSGAGKLVTAWRNKRSS